MKKPNLALASIMLEPPTKIPGHRQRLTVFRDEMIGERDQQLARNNLLVAKLAVFLRVRRLAKRIANMQSAQVTVIIYPENIVKALLPAAA